MLCVEGGRVSHSWCMCVVGHGYGGLSGGRDEVVDRMHPGDSRGVGRMSGGAGAHHECQAIHR